MNNLDQQLNFRVCDILRPFVSDMWQQIAPDQVQLFDGPMLTVNENRIWLLFDNDAENICPLGWWMDYRFDLVSALREAMQRVARKAAA